MADKPLDILLFTAFVNQRMGDGSWGVVPTSDVKFEVSLDDGKTFQAAERIGIPFVPDFFKLPPSPRPLTYRVRAVPTRSSHWPVSAKFFLQDVTFISRFGVPFEEQPEMEAGAWPLPVRSSIEDSTILQSFGFAHCQLIHHTAYLSRLRDSTETALKAINRARVLRFPDDWLPSWLRPVPSPIHLAGSPPVKDGRLNLDERERPFMTPTRETLILEVAGIDVPGVLGVTWSSGVQRAGAPTPFLVYFHPDLGQASSDYAGQPYPFGASYLYYACYRDLFHLADPVIRPDGSKGLNDHVTFARKAAVVVAPLPKLEKHLGVLKDASVMDELLREVQAFFYHRLDVGTLPQIGRVAIAAFSNGAGMHLRDFLQRNRSNPFVVEKVRELYLMDPRMNDDDLVNEVLAWAKSHPDDKRIRVYLSNQNQAYLKVVGKGRYEGSPGHLLAANGLRSVTLCPGTGFIEAATRGGASKEFISAFKLFGPVHEAIPGAMMTHALLESGFEPAFEFVQTR